MLNEIIKEKLKRNWGDRAASLDCIAEVKFIDPISSWCCYVFGMSPDEEMINCLIYSKAMGVEIHEIKLNEILSMFNEEGEGIKLDPEYRRTRVWSLLKRYTDDT